VVAGQLEIQLLANIARLSKDMNDAKKVVSSTMGNIDRVVGATTKILGAFGIGLSVNYFGKMIKGAIDAQDNLAKMSQKVGVSVTALAGLEHAASLSGVGMAGLEKGLKAISTQMFDASKGMATAQENFAALGINVNDATGALKSADAVMIEVADQFKAMEDGTTKTALATKLFGRAGLDLIPMLNEGSAGLASMVAEGQRLNPVTAESAKQAEIYNDNMERLSKTASAFGIILVNNLLPVISDMSEQMVAFTQSDKFGELLRDITTAAEILAAILLTRLVVSLGATTAGFVASTYQSLAYQAALARMAGISTAAAVGTTALAGTMGALNSAMMLVGGPVGALILITAGLALLISRMEDAEDRSKRLRGEISSLSEAQVKNAMAIAASEEEYARASLARAEATRHRSAADERAYQAQADRLKEITGRTKEYSNRLSDLKTGFKITTMSAAEYAASTVRVVRASEELVEVTEENISNTAFLNTLFAGVAVSATNTSAAYLELAGISRDTSKDMADYAAMIDGAVKQIPVSLTKVGDTSQEVSEQAARDWMKFRDSFSDAFADMMMDSDSFWEGLGNSAERTFYKIMGDFALSGLAGLLSGKGTSGFNLGSVLSNAGTSGTLIKGAASMLGIGGTAAAGAGVLTEAGYVAMMGGGTATAGAGAGLAGIGTSIAAGAQTALAAIPVAGWVALAAIAAWKVFGKESTPSFNAGLLLHDVPGAKANQKFDVDPFASGLDPVGFMRDQTEGAATAVIDTFRALDQTIVDIASKAGLSITANASTFTGLDERGLGSGVFLGSAGEEGKPGTSLTQQLDQYTKQLISTLSGQLDGEVLNRVLSSGNAEQMVAALNKELSMVEDAAGDAAQGIADAAEVLRTEIDLLTESKESLAATQALEAMSLIGSSFGGTGGTNYGTQYTNGIMTQGDAFRQAANDRIETGVASGQLSSYWENGVQYAGTKFTPESDADGLMMYGPQATPAGLKAQSSAQAVNEASTANAVNELKAVVQSLLTSINNNTRSSAARLDEINGEGVYTRAV